MYQSLEARFHDLFWNAEEGPGELELLQEFHRLHPGRGLELGCGSGRLLLPLLSAAFDIEGIDLSTDMLDLCREQAAATSLHPVLHHGNIEFLELPDTYATLTLPAFTFQLVNDPSRLLQSLHRTLHPGGWLYLTAFIPHSELEGDVPENQWYPDRDLVLPDQTRASVETRHSLDPESRLLIRHHRYALHSPDDALLDSHESQERIHWLEAHELTDLLLEHGFTTTDTIVNFDPHDDTPIEDATVFTLLAEKIQAP
ncbi:MAG: class I SAM-dependent methyltransferase [Verrucomicrobia bacterium]|nr:class I SAM-dependent methyltransferase [Verrucomicrobiota bacterium]MDA1006558.1 class I SAM-dependent methyltransferase [Verrucomicrobiota bacterium]